MNNALLLNSMVQLANALHTLNNQIAPHGADEAVIGHLQMFEKQVAQLRSELQPNSDVQPQLNKPDVSGRSEQLPPISDADKGFREGWAACLDAHGLED